MIEFGDIEDDYINSNEKLTHKITSNFKALKCYPEWFLNSDNNDHSSQFTINKSKADYFYMKKNYESAKELYFKCLSELNNTQMTQKRECWESISRCYMNLNSICESLKYAQYLLDSSLNIDHYTSSYSLYLDCYLRAKLCSYAVLYGQKLVILHPQNVDFWLKLGYAYAGFFRIELNCLRPNIDYVTSCSCQTSECHPHNISIDTYNLSNTYIVILCLLYAEFHIKSTLNSAVGEYSQINESLLNKIEKDVSLLNISSDSLKQFRESIYKKCTGVRTVKDNSEDEFIDRASSKFICSNKEVNESIEHAKNEDFVSEWFLCHVRVEDQL